MSCEAKCERCGHAVAAHCKGNQKHAPWRTGRSEMLTCSTRHCEEPLCSCVDLVEAA